MKPLKKVKPMTVKQIWNDIRSNRTKLPKHLAGLAHEMNYALLKQAATAIVKERKK